MGVGRGTGALPTSQLISGCAEDGVLVLQLAKLVPGEPWTAAVAGHQVAGSDVAEDQRRLMLERFQAEVGPLGRGTRTRSSAVVLVDTEPR